MYCQVLAMSTKHLTLGSQKPPIVEGKLRLYSMEYCPFSQRVRLVLQLKGIPHDIVNINLGKQPEWYSEVHPEGKVPALDIGTRVIVESLDIVEYLDEEYPEPPLYPKDPQARELDKILIQKIGPFTSVFYQLIFSEEKLSISEWVNQLTPFLKDFEKELHSRKSKYFSGSTPGMADYMLWPWAERAGIVWLLIGEKIPIEEQDYPCLVTWRKEMRQQPVIDAMYQGAEKFHLIILLKQAGVEPDYDNI